MMQVEHASRKGQNEQIVRFLLCDSSGRSELRSDDGELVHSPIHCLDKAIDGGPGVIAVRFWSMPIWDREVLVELCAALKRNSHTRKTPVLALLHAKHRKLLEDLDRVGVDFVKFIPKTTLNSTLTREIIDALSADDRVERQLEKLCPYIHYSMIDSRHEMTVCGAYMDRMVLGSRRLHGLCETEDHLQCEYFLNPRFNP